MNSSSFKQPRRKLGPLKKIQINTSERIPEVRSYREELAVPMKSPLDDVDEQRQW